MKAETIQILKAIVRIALFAIGIGIGIIIGVYIL